MKLLNMLSAAAVMVCAIYLSVHHTHELYMSVGFSDRHAWIAVIMSETLFVTGGLNVAVARFRDYRPGVPAYIGFFFGLGLVGWSNIASTANYGYKGWLLGGSIFVAVLITEMILTYAATKNRNQPTTEPVNWLTAVLNQSKPATTDQQDKPEPDDQPEPTEPDNRTETTKPAVPVNQPAIHADDEFKKAMEVAKKLYEESGKVPGRIVLSREAQCRDKIARNVSAMLRKQLA